ncbi:hypothetical protein TSYNTROPHJE_18730 [Tepidanaerobacter syntrophicus]|uniref:type IV toxin-antitoxin system AbiEi family antitoxin domain-containing protein n=1 Tax=Tepidanaerobacter syntrophicus TaxID=224999 RepID=UPI0022EF1AEB|nr:type IV toxin-antitoxin system AbiEi family antitoxin domain-containing protein [Tepidanaerobacter syntrophicus]GLI20060.1 hypothetical protein TSYNTROPHJE_18730 [Tepidanaerobacter syntrophicus]
MVIIGELKKEFQRRGGILKTAELNELGLSSRQIKKLLDAGVITKVKRGFYELTDYVSREEAIIGYFHKRLYFSKVHCYIMAIQIVYRWRGK